VEAVEWFGCVGWCGCFSVSDCMGWLMSGSGERWSFGRAVVFECGVKTMLEL